VLFRSQQAFERLFTLSNQKIMFEARGRFEKQLAAYGIPANVAEKIWTAWRTFAKESRGETWLGKSWRKSARVAKGKVPSSSALYATEKNIPNNKLEDIATKVLEDHYERLGGVPEELKAVWFSEEMRIAGSFTRRQLQKVPVMGEFLQHAYGTFAHNEWVTTRYFIFRFMLDPRFHAMNKGEGALLDWGRSGLKPAEIDKPMFGLDMRAIRAVGEIDTMSDVGYPFAVTRDARILRILAKEQPDVLRGVVANDPALFRKAMVELAEFDPELSVTIPKMGHTPDQWLKALDTEWGKIMRSADPEDVLGATIQREIDAAPALTEVYGRIYDANVKLIGDLKAMMYGNPNRGQIERVANSFLLYWPISYQIKATKWLLNILYGKIGGIQTGGLGAVALDRVQAEHERRMAEDPEYSRFFEENQALVFAAQMMVPITPAGIGVSLSPIWRNLFFPTSKKVLEIGPVYTVNGFLPSVSGDLYQYLKDVPGASVAYKAATGWNPPKEEEPNWPEGWAKPAP